MLFMVIQCRGLTDVKRICCEVFRHRKRCEVWDQQSCQLHWCQVVYRQYFVRTETIAVCNTGIKSDRTVFKTFRPNAHHHIINMQDNNNTTFICSSSKSGLRRQRQLTAISITSRSLTLRFNATFYSAAKRKPTTIRNGRPLAKAFPILYVTTTPSIQTATGYWQFSGHSTYWPWMLVWRENPQWWFKPLSAHIRCSSRATTARRTTAVATSKRRSGLLCYCCCCCCCCCSPKPVDTGLLTALTTTP